MGEGVRILAFYLMSYHGKIFTGVERRFLETSSNLTSLGARVFTLEYNPSLLESWSSKSYHSIGVNRKFRTHDVLEAIRLIMHGISACIRTRCDIIYVPGGFPHGSIRVVLPPLVVSLLSRKPLVVVIHHIRKCHPPSSQGTVLRIVRLLISELVKACITVSHSTARDIRKTFRFSNLAVTGNGVDPNTFRRIDDDEKLSDAVYFGRLTEEKGISTLLEAWKIVVRKLPSAKLLLMGCTERYMVDNYKRMVLGLGLRGNVAFIGSVSDEQAVAVLNSSKVFVFPSTEEGFGLTTLEAMAAGLPCVLSDLPPLREIFDPVAAFVKPKDALGFARAILEFLSNQERCAESGQRGRRLAKKYSWTAVAEKELEVLNSVSAGN